MKKYNNYEYQPNNQSHLMLAPVRMVVRAEEGLLLGDQVRWDPGTLCRILLARILWRILKILHRDVDEDLWQIHFAITKL